MVNPREGERVPAPVVSLRESTESGAGPERPVGAQAEMILGGRRYRLVPLDEPGEAAAVAVTPEVAEGVASLLTARELQIVALVAQGMVNKQVAGELHISEWTVSTHLRRIYAKLGVDTRAAMVNRCARVLSLRRR
jgi:ATP/maltotriose-dependent transcriptional regulator MalT